MEYTRLNLTPLSPAAAVTAAAAEVPWESFCLPSLVEGNNLNLGELWSLIQPMVPSGQVPNVSNS